MEIQLEQFAFCWFKSYFAACLPPSSCLFSVWDRIIIVSQDFMPCFAAAILISLKPRLCNQTTSSSSKSILFLLRSPAEIINTDVCLKLAIDIFTSLQQQQQSPFIISSSISSEETEEEIIKGDCCCC
eukprot:TRINITY_DN8742_c0_g2_i1.p1 TRINITY_DN8742_c0_g2~~TRINITY_DN8742_c0_g2_i1.p1  ORF type:complete len:128 (+),score=38.86 TRINITY_DN8742_c0_g2_i1:224-607(+)